MPPMNHDYSLLRSWLFVPGDSERKLQKALTTGTDAIIVDLEDAVAAENKRAARGIAAGAIDAWQRAGTLVAIRANALDTGLTFDDISATMACQPDAYMLPKVIAPDDLRRVSSHIAVEERRHGREPGSVRLVPIVSEHPRAVSQLQALCDADPRTAAVAWGTEDLSAAIGARRAKDADGRLLEPFRTVRALTVLAAAAAGLASLDTVVVEIDAVDVLRRESSEGADMGFTGKMAIHPSQVGPINEAFLPPPQAVAHARELLAAREQAGAGAFRFRGQMTDAPHLRMAARMVALDDAQRTRAAALRGPVA